MSSEQTTDQNTPGAGKSVGIATKASSRPGVPQEQEQRTIRSRFVTWGSKSQFRFCIALTIIFGSATVFVAGVLAILAWLMGIVHV